MKSRIPASLRVIGRSVVNWWDSWLDLVVIIILWVIAQITIVLGPPATFGMYYVIHEMLNGTSLGPRGFIEGARLFFWKALLWGVLNLLVIGLFFVNFTFYGAVQANWGFYLQVFTLMLGGLWLATQFYALPFFMMQENKSVPLALRNGLFTFLASPFYSFVFLVLIIIVLALCFFILPIFLGLPALIPVLGFRALYDRLEAFGLREREKTPKELEMEESGRIRADGLNWTPGQSPSSKPIAKGKGKIKDHR